MVNLIKQLINGLQVGSIYALVALGYTMVYGIVRLINFAHGDFIMVGSYAALLILPFLTSLGVPTWLCVIFSVIVCAMLGVVTERAAYKPLRNSPKISVLITAIGVSMFLENFIMLVKSPNPRPFTNLFNYKPVTIGEISISINALVTIAASIVIMVVLSQYVKHTRMGKAMRAVSEDAGAAQLVGINVNTTISLTFAIGSGLAAVAAVMYSSSYPIIDPLMGSMLGLKAFIAAVLGGIGVIPGAMIGGIIMGIAESLTKAYISSRLADAVVFGILIVVLLFKPSGILGSNVREKV